MTQETVTNGTEALFTREGMPPVKEMIPCALQHVLASFAGIITPAVIMAGVYGFNSQQSTDIIQVALILSAIDTALQAFAPFRRIGGGLPIVMGVSFAFGSEMEFYLFRRDENGEATHIPYDNAGYMDIAPEDKGENVRREICLTLEQMGIRPECSHHEQGPGQNEIDFRYSDPLTAADNAVTFKAVVNSVAVRNGLAADFSPKPLMGQPGNGMHINISAKSRDGAEVMPQIIAGILAHIAEMTVFLNTREESYHRFGSSKAPRYISWSSENRSQLIRIPAAQGEYRRAELRSPDPLCSPYLAFTLLIRAGLDGVTRQLVLPEAADVNFYTAANDVKARFHTLPETLEDARSLAASSAFIAEHLPKTIIQQYTH
mgnify:CR=1 FL=1